jgi:hypothetical protein
MDKMILKLPAVFFEDHEIRDLPSGQVIHRSSRYVKTVVTKEEYDEILSDAEHYATSMGEGGYGDKRVIGSANSTVGAFKRQPWQPASSQMILAVTGGDGPQALKDLFRF